jgi:AbrB family looped-hinge helix DNA binding protein
MKLQKRFNRKVGNKEYNKWVVNLPPEDVDTLGWKEGMELDVIQKDGKIILKPKSKD